MSDFNLSIIEEFHANGGQVGGGFAGAPLLLLHTYGAKSGAERINPLAYLTDGERFVVFASYAGADAHPAWFHNIAANPDKIQIEIGTETIPVQAEVITGPERDALYARQVAAMPGFADYEKKTTRVIPAIALTRR